MLDFLVLVVIAIAAVRSANMLRREKALFAEFRVPTHAIPLIYLFPLGPLTFLSVSAFTASLPLACLASVAILAPGVLAVRTATSMLERAGTSRTNQVEEALSVSFISGVGGIAYAIGATVLRLLLNVTAPVG